MLHHLGWKFDFDDDTIIVSKTMLRKINFVLQDMGVGSINGEMLKTHMETKRPRTMYSNDHM
jgi:hypothetical protein